MTAVTSLHEAVADLVHDGDTVALEGFTHLIPTHAGHEIIRQRRRDLTLVRMTPDLVYDQMIGMGVAGKLVFSWGGNPGVGSLHRFRDAVENGWPTPLEVDEHSHAGMANRYVAGASNLPFAVLRGYQGSALAARSNTTGSATWPPTGHEPGWGAALNADACISHGQREDTAPNVRLRGIVCVHREAMPAAPGKLRKVGELADERRPGRGVIVLVNV